jgi:hypothetical protein
MKRKKHLCNTLLILAISCFANHKSATKRIRENITQYCFLIYVVDLSMERGAYGATELNTLT